MQLHVRFKNDRKDYFFHGQVLDLQGDKIWIDDMVLGRIWFWRSQIHDFRELEYHDYLKLASKSERARLKMKVMQTGIKAVDTVKDIKNKLVG